MEELNEIRVEENPTFLKHVFSGTEESNAEILNAIQYAIMGVTPIIALNKLVQNYIPDVEADKGSLEILLEIFIQIAIMFGGIIIIHRMITYFPSYSGFKYDTFSVTTVILAFLIIMLSVQTKLGLKANILYERVLELWNGEPSMRENMEEGQGKKKVRVGHQQQQSQFDEDIALQGPPAPINTKPQQSHAQEAEIPDFGGMSAGPMAANSLVGGAFGSMF